MGQLTIIVCSSSNEVLSHYVTIDPTIDTQVSTIVTQSGKVLHNESLIYKLGYRNVVSNHKPPKQEDEPSLEDVKNNLRANDRDGNVIPIKITLFSSMIQEERQ